MGVETRFMIIGFIKVPTKRSKVFSLERLWIKLMALKGFGLVGLEYKTKKVFRLQIRFLAPPSLGDMIKCVFGVGGSLP